MFYLPHTPLTPPQLIYFPFLILFIFNFPPQFFSILQNFILSLPILEFPRFPFEFQVLVVYSRLFASKAVF